MGDPNDDDDDDNDDDDIVEEVVEETMEDMMDEDNEESIISTTGHSASSGKNLFDVGIVSKPPLSNLPPFQYILTMRRIVYGKSGTGRRHHPTAK